VAKTKTDCFVPRNDRQEQGRGQTKGEEMDRFDVMALAGMGIVIYGLYLISLPAMIIGIGAAMLAIGLVNAWFKARE
jgi:hypothetical protein